MTPFSKFSRVKKGVPSEKYLRIRLPGSFQWFIDPVSIEELRAVFEEARNLQIPTKVLGGGTSIVCREIVEGLVIRLSHFNNAVFEEDGVVSGAGCTLSRLVMRAAMGGYAGLEGLAGIPGTVGGAVSKNSGFLSSIGNFISQIAALDQRGNPVTIDRKHLGPDLSSSLSEFIVVGARFLLPRGNFSSSVRDFTHTLDAHKKKMPTNRRSVRIFRDEFSDGSPAKAVDILQLSGCLGLFSGGASLCSQNPNFIVDAGSSTAGDILTLTSVVGGRVKKRFGKELRLDLTTW